MQCEWLNFGKKSTGALIQSVVTCLIAKLQNNGTQPLIGNLATTFSGAFIMCITATS